MEKNNRYFIGIVPGSDICEEIDAFKQDFACRFAAKHALKNVPHITLKAPFLLAVSEHARLLEWFTHLSITAGPFNVALRDFDAFKNNRNPVVFVKPVLNAGLSALQKEILTQFQTSFPSVPIAANEFNFTPHVTVAYRDLKTEKFRAAWKEYQTRKYSSSFEVNDFHLFLHEEKWNIIQTCVLPSEGSSG